MESLEDILKLVFSLVFGAIYLFGGQLFKGNKEDKPQQRPTSQKTNEDDPAASEHEARQREIREAIRRKIMERRGEKNSSEPTTQEPALAQNRDRSVEGSATLESEYPSATGKTVAPAQKTAKADDQTTKADDQFSWDISDNVYDKEMQQRLQQIEATKRRAKALKQQIDRRLDPRLQKSDRSRKPTSKGVYSGSIRSTLHNPGAARKAFVYSEILGKPLSLKQSGVSGHLI